MGKVEGRCLLHEWVTLPTSGRVVGMLVRASKTPGLRR